MTLVQTNTEGWLWLYRIYLLALIDLLPPASLSFPPCPLISALSSLSWAYSGSPLASFFRRSSLFVSSIFLFRITDELWTMWIIFLFLFFLFFFFSFNLPPGLSAFRTYLLGVWGILALGEGVCEEGWVCRWVLESGRFRCDVLRQGVSLLGMYVCTKSGQTIGLGSCAPRFDAENECPVDGVLTGLRPHRRQAFTAASTTNCTTNCTTATTAAPIFFSYRSPVIPTSTVTYPQLNPRFLPYHVPMCACLCAHVHMILRWIPCEPPSVVIPTAKSGVCQMIHTRVSPPPPSPSSIPPFLACLCLGCSLFVSFPPLPFLPLSYERRERGGGGKSNKKKARKLQYVSSSIAHCVHKTRGTEW